MGKEAIIIGGSLAGLMHGIMLKRHGYAVTVLEAEAAGTERVNHAAGISAGPDVVAFMEQHDRTGRAYTIGTKNAVFIDKDLRPRYTMPRSFNFTSWGLLSNMLRANFDGTPSKAVPEPPKADEGDGPVEFRAGKRVASVEDAGDKVLVHYEDVADGSKATQAADLVVAADGSNSLVRSILMPDVKRQYAGYVSWRGTVPESRVSDTTRKFFDGVWTAHLMHRTYILVYVIPTDDGCMEEGGRLLNWVWYHNLAEDSPELEEAMTDVSGKRHYGTVPRGQISPAAWAKQKALGLSVMPAPIAELIEKTETPFVTRINDAVSTRASFFGGKLFFVGDALVAFRPHIALSTNQAALHARLLQEVVEQKIKPADWSGRVLRWGRATWMLSIVVGTFGQGTRLALVWSILRYILLIIGQKLRIVN